MEDWLNELNKDIKNKVKAQSIPMPNSQVNQMNAAVNSKSEVNTWLVVLGIIVIAVTIYFIAEKKGVVISSPIQHAPHYQQPFEQKQTDVARLTAQYEELVGVTNKVWNRTKWNSERMALLATVNNHNLVVIQNNYPKTELILLNSNWSINRMPNRITLTPEQKQFLQQFVATAENGY